MTTAVLRKAVTVPQSPDEAFRLFTEEIATWWPLRTHSVGGESAVTVAFDLPRRRLVETLAGGEVAIWGEVLEWDPPQGLRLSWHPGTPPDQATTVDVRFRANAAGGTEIVLVQADWERRPDGEERRQDYDTGWDLVLGGLIDGATARVGTT